MTRPVNPNRGVAKLRSAWIWFPLLLLAGALVYLPALRSPYFLDDYVHASMAAGTFPIHRSPLDLYNFIDEADRPVLWARGMLPWWADPHLHIRFFRPLSSALVWSEHRLLGDAPLLLHLHSLLWWAAAILGARALFRRLLPRRPAALATLIFALAPCHAFPLGWLANREILVSTALGLPALAAHLRFREGEGLRHGIVAAALFALSMAGGEYAICFGGYVLAFEVVRRGERPLRRILGLLPFAIPAAAYLGARAALGYGTRGSGFYADPLGEPWAFLAALPRRVGSLLLDGWLSLDHETVTTLTPWWQIAFALAALLVLVGPPIVRLHRDLDAETARASRGLLLGSLMALAPVTAVIPSPRVLGLGVLGIAGTVALLLDRAWLSAPPEEAGAARPRAAEHTLAAALVLGFAHLVHAPVTSFLVSRGFHEAASSFAEHVAALRERIATGEGGRADAREVSVIRGMAASLFLPWLDRREPAPPWRVLAQTGHVLALRTGPRSLDLIMPPGQGAFSQGAGNLWRSDASTLAPGDVIQAPGMRVTVLEVGAAGPRRVRYELDRPLSAPSLLWISEDRTGFPEASLPAVGFGVPFDP